MSDWNDIDTAPYSTPVLIKVSHMTFEAQLLAGASINDAGDECDQWVAVHEGEHPPCWTDGACWESNADEMTSMQPEGWRPLS